MSDENTVHPFSTWLWALLVVGLMAPTSSLILLSTSHTVLTIVLNSLAFGVIFRWLPKRPVKWRYAIRGGPTDVDSVGNRSADFGSVLNWHALHNSLWGDRVFHRAAIVVLLGSFIAIVGP